MGILDLLKQKAPKQEEQPKHTYYQNEDENAYIRKLHVAGVTFKNEDGTDRQKILKDIKMQKPPFDKKLVIGIEQYEWEGEPAYYITVNGMTIGSAPKKIVPFITNNKDRITGIVDFWVGQDVDNTYYARCVIQVEKKQ